ncbi:carboxylesterase family protein [Hymenobacter sp. BT175]|uniref:carboxylesterase family protein n=1 Tax=Hymenobacter translucens TaxID=2886507 RepID=UPI001D0EBEAB|nr:carboxylesterase family protein [Hymenobacter translucens]MCC2548919.1 carboxylesterase family protein [Hymenobacter translucens]
MRKYLLLSLLFVLSGLAAFPAAAQIDTTGGRYHRAIFPLLTTTLDVPYGSAVTFSGSTQILRMNVYEPTGDTVRRRPLLIFAHGGGFAFGSKGDQDVTELAQRFARLGYVTASIDYRLGFFPFNDTIAIAKAAIRGSQDMRAAVRFFRQDAATAKLYRVHSSFIFVGGSSAGAFMALQNAFLDKDSEVPAYLNVAQLGGVEGNSGNPGYSSVPSGAINLCGALGRPWWIEPGNLPFVSMHGTFDTTVPYQAGTVGGGLPPQYVYGSAILKVRATEVGVFNPFYTFKGAPHVPYSGTGTTAAAYMDTTFRFVRDFLRPQLVASGPLPVTLTRFEAERQGENAVLTWVTATEIDNAGFEVQVAIDGRTYRALGRVPASAGSSGAHSYRYVDAEPNKTGRRYYRLRQLDTDGKEAFYGPRVLSFDAGTRLQAYPNPFTDQLLVDVPAAAGTRVQLRNALGQLVLSREVAGSELPVRIELALPAGLRPGWYVLTVQSDLQTRQVRLLKK